MPGPDVVLVIPDSRVRRLVGVALEVDGARVHSWATLADAVGDLSASAAPGAIVLDSDLASDQNARTLVERAPDARVVLLGSADKPGPPLPSPFLRAPVIPPDDLGRLVEATVQPCRLEPGQLMAGPLLVQAEAEVVGSWRELCRWDPMLPPDAEPPMPEAMVRAVADALTRPQPLGWGPDPEVERVTEAFTFMAGSLDVAIGQLVCLREAVREQLTPGVPPDEREETWARLTMIVDRAIGVAANRATDRLLQDAFVDALTGLLNRRALERDVRREVGRAARKGRRFSLVVIDLDHLKEVNDTQGHLAGDRCLQALADACRRVLRAADSAYRIGGDEFVLLLPETDAGQIDAVGRRLAETAAPKFSLGAATYPDDGSELDSLLDVADQRLFQGRRARRGGGPSRAG